MEFRKIEVEENPIKKSEGSARVKIGNTEVIAGVKLDLVEPYTDSPEEGNLIVNVEFTPMSNPEFEPGPPDENAIELARIVDRGIRESQIIKTKELCVEKGEKVWGVFIDIYTLNHDGDLIDASALAAAVALKNAVFPKVKDGKVEYGELTNKKLPLRKEFPITLTFYKIGSEIIVDPLIDEELCADARLTVALTLNPPRIHALQKGEEATFTAEEILKIIDLAFEKAKELKRFL